MTDTPPANMYYIRFKIYDVVNFLQRLIIRLIQKLKQISFFILWFDLSLNEL